MEDCLPFLKSSIPLHSGIFHIPYRNFRSIFLSIPYHAMPWSQVRNLGFLSMIQKQKGKFKVAHCKFAKAEKNNNEQIKNHVLAQASFVLGQYRNHRQRICYSMANGKLTFLPWGSGKAQKKYCSSEVTNQRKMDMLHHDNAHCRRTLSITEFSVSLVHFCSLATCRLIGPWFFFFQGWKNVWKVVNLVHWATSSKPQPTS